MYYNIEIFFIDDGFFDNVLVICDVWQYKDECVYVLYKINFGVLVSRNVGFYVVKGEYVCFVDGDDWIEFDFVEYMLEF